MRGSRLEFDRQIHNPLHTHILNGSVADAIYVQPPLPEVRHGVSVRNDHHAPTIPAMGMSMPVV